MAQPMQLVRGMKILTTLIVCSAVSVGGYYSWQKAPAPKPQCAPPAMAAPSAAPAPLVAEEPLPNLLNAVEVDSGAAPKAPASAVAGTTTTGEPVAMVFDDS